jgi:hypothetical protein
MVELGQDDLRDDGRQVIEVDDYSALIDWSGQSDLEAVVVAVQVPTAATVPTQVVSCLEAEAVAQADQHAATLARGDADSVSR